MPDILEQPMAGVECLLFYNSETNEAPTWVEVKNARDVADADTLEKVDAAARYSKRKRYVPGQAEGGIKFDYVYIKPKAGGAGDAVFNYLNTKYQAREPIQCCVADGPMNVPGTVYHKDYYFIADFSKGQPLNGGFLYTVELAPTVVFIGGSMVEETYGTVE